MAPTMLFADHRVVVRGGGDLATGVVARLHRAGFPVVICELAHPLTVRRTVALSTAVLDGTATVEGVAARRATVDDIDGLLADGIVPVLTSPQLPPIERSIVVDARLAKRNIDTAITDAPLVIGLGPGFLAAVDCHAIVETQRGSRLGRVLWHGSAEANTGIPGEVGGRARRAARDRAHLAARAPAQHRDRHQHPR